MNPVRPAAYPATPAPQAETARMAAQRAFFQAAVGATPAAAPPPAPAASAAPIHRTPEPGAEPPTRILRPGSLLDIRV